GIPIVSRAQRRPERLRLWAHEAIGADLFELAAVAGIQQAIVGPVVGNQKLRRARRHIRVSAKDRRASRRLRSQGSNYRRGRALAASPASRTPLPYAWACLIARCP